MKPDERNSLISSRFPVRASFLSCKGRNGRVWLPVLVAAIAGGLGWQIARSNNRLFQGKPEAGWINSLTNGYSGQDLARWQTLGPDAAPILIRALRKGAGPFARAYAEVWPKLPAAIGRWLPKPDESAQTRIIAALLLGRLGSNPKISVPALVQALRDENRGVRMNAVSGLNRLFPVMGKQKPEIMLIFVQLMQDKDEYVRNNVAFALRHCEDQPGVVVPVLTKALSDPALGVRNSAALALVHIDPQAAAKQDPAVMVPGLIEGLHFKDLSRNIEAALALGNFGPAARAAIPSLKELLENQNAEVRNAAANALKQIDPAGVERGP